jgi:hypothetical protein
MRKPNVILKDVSHDTYRKKKGVTDEARNIVSLCGEKSCQIPPPHQVHR